VRVCSNGCSLFRFEDAENYDQRQLQTLDKKQRQNLELNWQSVAELIEHADDLISELHMKTCITSRQLNTLKKQPQSLKIKKLLEILSRKNVAVIDVFVGCLPDNAQHHVLSLLENISGNWKCY
jgi:hypothetical protein